MPPKKTKLPPIKGAAAAVGHDPSAAAAKRVAAVARKDPVKRRARGLAKRNQILRSAEADGGLGGASQENGRAVLNKMRTSHAGMSQTVTSGGPTWDNHKRNFDSAKAEWDALGTEDSAKHAADIKKGTAVGAVKAAGTKLPPLKH